MKKEFNLFTECHNIAIKDKAVLLGYANMIIFMCRPYSAFRVLTLDFWISPAIDHKQILFLFDSTSKPIGYVTWAHLAPDTEQRLLKDQSFLLHPSEWNEGGRTWIIDFCFPCGGVKEAIHKLKKFFQNENIDDIFWVRRNIDYPDQKGKTLRGGIQVKYPTK
ncbi:toxin-activating lysine-acyltransferase [Pseudomonas sp. Irchel s3b2]|uniref:toxin-activating lysine-acyltransferase n=1 Tax=Pseudomonas sp. Irchel s3b2 TaxID=2009073 RepID=UPI001C477F09|nr:toxin-activating lysine-acyltransferase [Pseudomonas sp. Irchel s3b2]